MELLQNPLKDRQVNSTELPVSKRMDHYLFYSKKSNYKLPDYKTILLYLKKQGKLMKDTLINLLNNSKKILKEESNVLYLNDPAVIIGDLNGQYYDLLKIFEISNNFETKKYIFLGNYINKGFFSTEILILLLSIKVNITSLTIIQI